MDIGRQRLRTQHIAAPGYADPGNVVSWLGAVQAQDYAGGLWAVGTFLGLAPTASEVHQVDRGRP